MAVAAVVALAVILGLSLFTGDGAGKTYARVVDQLHRAHTLTYSSDHEDRRGEYADRAD